MAPKDVVSKDELKIIVRDNWSSTRKPEVDWDTVIEASHHKTVQSAKSTWSRLGGATLQGKWRNEEADEAEKADEAADNDDGAEEVVGRKRKRAAVAAGGAAGRNSKRVAVAAEEAVEHNSNVAAVASQVAAPATAAAIVAPVEEDVDPSAQPFQLQTQGVGPMGDQMPIVYYDSRAFIAYGNEAPDFNWEDPDFFGMSKPPSPTPPKSSYPPLD